MDTRRALDGRGMLVMLALCMIWGLQQVELKAVAGDISPMLQISLRSGIGALLVALLMFKQGQRINFAQTWQPGLLAGILFGLEFVLVGAGLHYTSASHLVLFLYTAPIFVALGMQWLFPAERLSKVQWFGVLLAFAGITVSFLWSGEASPTEASDMLLGDFFSLLAGLAWGATTILIRCSALSSAPATETLFYQLAVAFVLILLGSWWTGQMQFQPTLVVWGSLLFQGVVIAFASFLIWFGLLRRYMAAQLGVFSFLTPLFGVIFGVWLLDEQVDGHFMLGAAMVLLGIMTVSSYRWFVMRWGK